jgi:ABC-2 type transport system ATP-binding protein
MGDSETVIRAEHLRHAYTPGRYALQDLSFSVQRGEVFGLLGRNGAGKSTLIKVMTTLLRPTEGQLEVLGLNPMKDGQRIRSRIGVVQQGESFDFTTVEGNLDIYGVLWGVPPQERRRRKEDLIARFGLEELRRRRSFDLSGGQKRRVQVAREFMHEMDILFLDEPTVGLDVIMRRTLLDSIRAEVRRGLTVVFTTHNLEEADYLCDRIAVVDNGRLLALETLEKLKQLYGGRKTIDLTVTGDRVEQFYGILQAKLSGIAELTVSGRSAVLLSSDPKGTLADIVALAQHQGVGIEWVTVRQNTLEDVFLRSVGHEGESIGSS